MKKGVVNAVQTAVVHALLVLTTKGTKANRTQRRKKKREGERERERERR